MLSKARKFVFIKLNLIDIPQFSIKWFKYLKYMYKEIDKVNRNMDMDLQSTCIT